MIPVREANSFSESINIVTTPSFTFKVNFIRNRVGGVFDKIDALVQSVYKTLSTERYCYEIYNWDYGVELDDLIGMPKEYVKVQLPYRIQEALSVDERINRVHSFEFYNIKEEKSSLGVSFILDSIFGQVSIDWRFDF